MNRSYTDIINHRDLLVGEEPEFLSPAAKKRRAAIDAQLRRSSVPLTFHPSEAERKERIVEAIKRYVEKR